MFCQYCGKEIAEGGVCDCQNAAIQSEDFNIPLQNDYPQPQQPDNQTQQQLPQQYSNQPQQYSNQPHQYNNQPQQYGIQPHQYSDQPQPYYSQPPQAYSQPQPPYYGQPQINYNYNPISRQSNGPATTGFVFALISIFLGWIPFIGWVFWILGLVFSIVGLATSGRRGGAGRGLGIAGVIISAVDLIVIIVVSVTLIATYNYFSFNPYYWF